MFSTSKAYCEISGSSDEDEIISSNEGIYREEVPVLESLFNRTTTTQQTPFASEQSQIQNRKWTQYLAALITTIGGFIMGTTLAWTAPAGPMLKKNQYPFRVTENDVSWIAAFMPFGAFLGCIITASIVEKLGRKVMMHVLTLPALIGWTTIIFAESVEWIYAGRVLTGFASGSYSIIVPLYTSEIADTEIRGTLGTYFQLQVTAGLLYTYIMGSYLNVFGLSTACAIIPMVYTYLIFFVPESPIYYLKRGNLEMAKSSLKYFRGIGDDVDKELMTMRTTLAQAERKRCSIIKAFQTTPAKRGLLIGIGIMIFQQFTGCDVIIFYVTDIFNATGSTVDSNTSTVIVGVMSVLSTYFSTLFVDRLGRKILLLISIVTMGICTLIIGGFYYANDLDYDVSYIEILPLISLCAYIIIFSIGFGPIPWMLMGEIFPAQIKGVACSVVCMSNWIFTFFIVKFFTCLVSTIHMYNTFWLFTTFSLLGTIFVWLFIPETKGKAMEEIQELLGAGKNPLPLMSSIHL